MNYVQSFTSFQIYSLKHSFCAFNDPNKESLHYTNVGSSSAWSAFAEQIGRCLLGNTLLEAIDQ